ncbi:hypothetical protein CMO93_03090 [Candidatus Woesearchaeota archaeon]|nr:hypothetical protein [Candidatus Woesearchaeota archaeon]|tara:strand:+ start:13189 stop:14277 length:1089 start_codon:yes stop_codon:yes gene_type:complete
MDFAIYTTEKCNLTCKYCDGIKDRNYYAQDLTYNKDLLIDFLRKVPNLSLHFYGGEPLLNIDLIKEVLNKVPNNHVNLQTNGLMLNKLDNDILNKFDVISVSLDGSQEATDQYRGKGVYQKAIDQIKLIKNKGYHNQLNVRMTTNPGNNIEQDINHFINDCEVKFDSIHWQLNVLFHFKDWEQNKDEIKDWLINSYNPKITSLVKMWTKEIITKNNVINLVPFMGIIHSLLTNSPVHNLRCGAGCNLWVITTTGNIYPCPVIREFPEYDLGNIADLSPKDIKPAYVLHNCHKCEVFSLCGGRCLYTNHKNQWDEEGYKLVCNSVKHLIRNLIKVYPIIKKLVAQSKISINDFDAYQNYEVIP